MATSRDIGRGDRLRISVAGVVTVVAILLLVLSHRNDDPGSAASPSERPTTTSTATTPPATTPAATTTAPSTTPSSTPDTTPRTQMCPAAARACVDLDRREAWLQADGRVVYGPVPMEPGTGDALTPRGAFAVSWKDEEHISGEYGDPMPFSVFFAPGGIAFHEGSLTTPSHGCVHLRHDDAAHFFAQLQPGDPVTVF